MPTISILRTYLGLIASSRVKIGYCSKKKKKKKSVEVKKETELKKKRKTLPGDWLSCDIHVIQNKRPGNVYFFFFPPRKNGNQSEDRELYLVIELAET